MNGGAALDGAKRNKRKVCWPEEWVMAAINAGLAEQAPSGTYRIIGGDAMREKLQIFASELLDLDD